MKCKICKTENCTTTIKHLGVSIKCCEICSNSYLCGWCCNLATVGDRCAKCNEMFHKDSKASIDYFYRLSIENSRLSAEETAKKNRKIEKNGYKWCASCGNLHHESTSKCLKCKGR